MFHMQRQRKLPEEHARYSINALMNVLILLVLLLSTT